MNTLTNLLKDHQIGIWCKRAAWIILVIGLVEVISNIYTGLRQFSDQPLALGGLLLALPFGLGVLPRILFYFFILYAAGAVVNYFVGNEDDEADNEDDEADND